MRLVFKANESLAIHGDKQQNERDWVLNEFKTGKSPIMVATDVASRGIGMIDCAARSLPLPQLTLCGSIRDALLSAKVCSVSAMIRSKLIVSSFGSLARGTLDTQCSVACYIFSFRLIMYHQGTEADWTFLDLFKLHFQGFSRTTISSHALDQAIARFLLQCRESS